MIQNGKLVCKTRREFGLLAIRGPKFSAEWKERLVSFRSTNEIRRESVRKKIFDDAVMPRIGHVSQ
jgi:hypothetical protein